MTITLNELHDLTIPVAEDFNANFRALKAGQEAIEALAATMVPMVTGAIVDYGGDTAPAGWLLCDGAAVSRTTYSALFAALGTKWGAGDGSSTFNVPDFRGRVSVGAGTGTSLTERLIGGHGGEESHVLTAPEMAWHSHPVSDPGHSHWVNGANNVAGAGPTGAMGPGIGSGVYDMTVVVGNLSNITIAGAGGNVAHNTMPPFAVATKIIKT